MENYLNRDATLSPKNRPLFLMVLCILTFIGSGSSIVYNLAKYVTSNTNMQLREKAVADLKEQLDNIKTDNTGKYVLKKALSGVEILSDPSNQKKYAVYSIIASFMSLAGGFLMFKLRKAGFWMYVAGIILSSASAFIVFGIQNTFAILTITATAVIIFFGIVFIVLYGLNFKYLR